MPERIDEHTVGVLRGRSVGQEVQAAAGEEGGIDLRQRDELLQDKSLVPVRAQLLQLLGFDHDVLAAGVFVAADDSCRVDGAVAGAMLLVADALAAVGVEHMTVRRR